MACYGWGLYGLDQVGSCSPVVIVLGSFVAAAGVAPEFPLFEFPAAETFSPGL